MITVRAARFKKVYEREIQDEAVAKRNQIVKELLARVDAAAERHQLDLVLDSSAQSFKGVNVILYNQKSLDLTDEILREFQP